MRWDNEELYCFEVKRLNKKMWIEGEAKICIVRSKKLLRNIRKQKIY